MKITVDHELCNGHARCATFTPGIYTLDEGGYCSVSEADVTPGSEDDARRGVDNCPERAITIVE